MSEKINFRSMLGVNGGQVIGLHSHQYFDCKFLAKAIQQVELSFALDSGLNDLEKLGLMTLVKLYESNVKDAQWKTKS